MKKMTCRELGGACDEIITGKDPEEMGENSKKHAMLMHEQGDEAHMAAMEKMSNMSTADFNVFWDDFLKRFDQAEAV